MLTSSNLSSFLTIFPNEDIEFLLRIPNTMCQENYKFLLKEMGLHNGLLLLKDMEECGEGDWVSVAQAEEEDHHKFEKIGKLVSYAPEITAHVEQGKIKKHDSREGQGALRVGDPERHLCG